MSREDNLPKAHGLAVAHKLKTPRFSEYLGACLPVWIETGQIIISLVLG
jgi:hypothetical protein